MTSLVNTNSDETAKAIAHHQAAVLQDEKKGQSQSIDPLLLAYMCVFHAVQISNQTADIQAKVIQNNVNAQNQLIDLESKFNFFTLSKDDMFNKIQVVGTNIAPYIKYTPKKVAQTELENLTTKNQGVSAIRNTFEDKIRVLGQEVQMDETKVNTDVNNTQQSMQQGSGIMQMMLSLTNQISRI